MTLHEFATDVIPILATILSLIGFIGVYMIWYQIKQTNAWNRANTQHTLLSDLPTEDLDRRFTEIYRKYKDKNDLISNDKARAIYDNLDEFICVKSFINKIEHLCAAINAETINDDYAYSVHSVRVTNIFRWFESYIKLIRDIQKDNEIYLELEKVATRWNVRHLKAEKQIQTKIQTLQAARGTKRAVP